MGQKGPIIRSERPAQRGEAPGEVGVQGRKVVGVAEVAKIPHLLNATRPACFQHFLHYAEIVLIRLTLYLAPPQPFPDGPYIEFLQKPVVLPKLTQMIRYVQEIHPVAVDIELVGAFVAAHPERPEWILNFGHVVAH